MSKSSRFKAEFKPTRTDDLQDEAKPFVGKVMEFSHAWTMNDDDPFPGEDAYMCHEEGFYLWVPERDLKRLSA